MKLYQVLFWESLQNLPMILGFMIAARIRTQSFLLALFVLLLGIVGGNVIMHFTEYKLHETPVKSSITGTLVNIIMFTVLAIPFLFYFTVDTRWINWKTDILFGVVVGVLMTAGQTTVWEGPKSRMVIHGAAMAASFPLIMLGIRYALRINSWGLFLLSGFMIVILGSLVIVLIDYRKMIK